MSMQTLLLWHHVDESFKGYTFWCYVTLWVVQLVQLAQQ